MTFDQLVAFLAVVSEGTFSGASQVLHKSQPAVSKLVRNLEEELGIALLDRDAYRPTLTDAGRRFHERAVVVAEDADALLNFGRSLGGHQRSLVRIAIEAIAPLSRVLRVLGRVQRRFPEVRYELSTERMNGAIEALDDGRADLVISGKHARRSFRNRSTEVQRFGTVRVLPVVSAKHPLAAAQAPITPRALRVYPQVVLRESGSQELSSSVNVLEGGLRWTVTDVGAKREVLLQGMGWGGLPEHVIAQDLARGRLVALDIPSFEVRSIELFLLRRQAHAFDEVIQALWEGLEPVG